METGKDTQINEKENYAVIPYRVEIIREFKKNKLAVLGLIIFIAIITICIFAPFFTKYNPILNMNLKDKLLPPGSPGHFLGTDDYGRDIWSRLIFGGRTSLLTGISVALLSAFIGVAIGCISGYFGGIIDGFSMRITDIMLSFPFLIIAIAIMAALGANQRNIVITLAIVSWPGFARLTRGQVLMIKKQEYVESAKVAGLKDLRIMINHVLPNCWGPIIVQLTLTVGSAILSAASLNFLGLGIDATIPDWGVMLNQGRDYLQSASYLTTIPGVAISLSVLSINWIGDGLRDAFDPKQRK